jgi:hypothetical protein
MIIITTTIIITVAINVIGCDELLALCVEQPKGRTSIRSFLSMLRQPLISYGVEGPADHFQEVLETWNMDLATRNKNPGRKPAGSSLYLLQQLTKDLHLK